jgi:predicted Zn-dependent protease
VEKSLLPVEIRAGQLRKQASHKIGGAQKRTRNRRKVRLNYERPDFRGASLVNLRKGLISVAAAITALGSTLAQAQGISILRDAEMEQFLDDHTRPILEAAGVAPDSIHILIVNDGSFNAFAGGRYLGVNTGMLTITDTPAQVEAILAHEAGHLAGGHTARSGDAISAATRPMLLSLILAAGAIAAGAPEAGIGIFSLGQTIGTANYLIYSRSQESASDQAAVTYLDRLGHSSKGALEVWAKMRNSQIIRGNRINPYQQTHPMANARLSALRQRVEASPYYDVEDSPEEITRLRLIQAKIRGFLHEPETTLDYYPLTDQSDPAYYARAVAYYRQSKMDTALSEVRVLTTKYPDNPFYHELEGQMLFEFGRPNDAIAPYQQSVKLFPDNALLRINLGRALLATDEPSQIQEGVTELKRALLLEPDNSFGWFELARGYSSLGNDIMANLATAESKYQAGSKPEANVFARRAMVGLRRGTPEWRQAADIILASQPESGGAPLPAGIGDEQPAPRKRKDDTKKSPDVPDPTFGDRSL